MPGVAPFFQPEAGWPAWLPASSPAWAEQGSIARPELVERRARASQPVRAWLLVELVFSQLQQVSRQALQVQVSQPVRAWLLVELVFSLPQQVSRQVLQVQASQPVWAWLLVESVFSLAQQVSRQVSWAQPGPQVAVQVGRDSPARLPGQHEPESRERSVRFAGLAWSPQLQPDARDSPKQTADGSVPPLVAAVSASSLGECAARVWQRVPPAQAAA